MYRKIKADKIHTISNGVLMDHVLILDNEGVIRAMEPIGMHDPSSVKTYKGELIPGFVNAHCHLELSHMKGLVPTGTGLLPFLQSVVKFREFPEEEILEAIKQADKYMYDSGIMAVGDISNKTDSFHTKLESHMRYYTFVEFFDLMQADWTARTWEQYYQVYLNAPNTGGHNRSCVPHAPYSMTEALFEKVCQQDLSGGTVSIHNQETEAENELFMYGTGGFRAFYKDFGLSLEHFQAIRQRSIHYALRFLDPKQRTLFVHNTTCTAEDLSAAHAWNNQCYWVSCPNANLYIENRLPNYKVFKDAGAKMCLGTDSLTSNWQLSIWEEIQCIRKYQSYVSFEELLQWATLNGAEALGFNDTLGSFEVGKKPGVLLVDEQRNTISRLV